ncbi:MAG: transporter [Alphaproteobacteria bacterium]|nr:transporter [Alphaproteobacteria bacterium]
MIHYLLLALGIALGVIGQLLLKSGADSAGIVEQFLRLPTIAGLGFYGLAAICYTLALRAIPLSVAYPSVSASYVIVVVVAHLMWKEPLGLQQLAAVALISGGIGLLYWKA